MNAPVPANDQVVTAWAASLDHWDDGLIETEFTDPTTGELFTFRITRCCPATAKPAGEDRERLLIRARGEAMRELAKAHPGEFETLVDARLRELGIGTPEPARRP
jgi:hypothetical protein